MFILNFVLFLFHLVVKCYWWCDFFNQSNDYTSFYDACINFCVNTTDAINFCVNTTDAIKFCVIIKDALKLRKMPYTLKQLEERLRMLTGATGTGEGTSQTMN